MCERTIDSYIEMFYPCSWLLLLTIPHKDIDKCVQIDHDCLIVPLLLFCALNAAGVLVAACLVVFVSVSNQYVNCHVESDFWCGLNRIITTMRKPPISVGIHQVKWQSICCAQWYYMLIMCHTHWSTTSIEWFCTLFSHMMTRVWTLFIMHFKFPNLDFTPKDKYYM